jgi:hypothetical protein
VAKIFFATVPHGSSYIAASGQSGLAHAHSGDIGDRVVGAWAWSPVGRSAHCVEGEKSEAKAENRYGPNGLRSHYFKTGFLQASGIPSKFFRPWAESRWDVAICGDRNFAPRAWIVATGKNNDKPKQSIQFVVLSTLPAGQTIRKFMSIKTRRWDSQACLRMYGDKSRRLLKRSKRRGAESNHTSALWIFTPLRRRNRVHGLLPDDYNRRLNA